MFISRILRKILLNKKKRMDVNNNIIKAWKIFTVAGNNKLKFLYHGINKNRYIKFNKWLRADIKKVRDGSGEKYYKSGFHAYLTLKSALKWLEVSTKDEKRIIYPVFIKNWDYKKSAKFEDTVLAKYIYVPSNPILNKDL